MDPVTAGLVIGGSFLSQMMSKKAQEEQMKKQNAIQLALKGGEDQQQALQNLMSYYQSALGGR